MAYQTVPFLSAVKPAQHSCRAICIILFCDGHSATQITNNQLRGDRVHSTDTYTRYGMLFDLRIRLQSIYILIFRYFEKNRSVCLQICRA